MHKKIFNAIELLNTFFQAFYMLALPIGIGALASFLLTKYLSVPSWIWAVLLTIGVLTGLVSMVKFILTTLSGMDKRERQIKLDEEEKKEKEARQAWLRDAGKDIDTQNDE